MQKTQRFYLLRRLIPYFFQEKKRFLLSLISVMIVTATQLVRPYILRFMIDSVSNNTGVYKVYYASGLFILSLIIGSIFSYFQVVLLAKMGVSIINKIKHKLFSHVLKQGMSFFDKNQPGKLMSRTESDIEQLKVIFTNSSITIISSTIILIGIIGIIWFEQPKLGILIAFLSPIVFLVFSWYIKMIRKVWHKARIKNSELSGFITEYVQGIPILQLFCKKDKALEKLDKLSREKYKYNKKGLFLDTVVFWSSFQFFSETASMILIFSFGIDQIFKGNMTVGTLVMFGELLRQFFWPLRNLMMVINQVNVSLAAAERVFDILDTKSDVHNNFSNDDIPHLKDCLEWKHLTFSYDKDEVIKDISLKISKGEHVAFVGASGSGKTTMINLLLRFYDQQKGEILIDGEDIREYSVENFRKDIGLVLQEVNLFPGTIMENLKAFNPDIEDEKVIKAAKRIGAHDFISKKENKYQEIIAEGGKNLSMGERQLISFTRAIVNDPDILILDEATSNVDVITENMLQQALFRLMQDRTAIIIAHRLSTIEKVNNIYVFDKGKIVESGDHNTLLKKEGIYKRLFDIQSIDRGGYHEKKTQL